MTEDSLPELILYSTSACTLCEQTLDALLGMASLNGSHLEVVDIAEDPQLLALYAERIPVLKVGDVLLDHPIDEAAIHAALGNHTL